jgi:hypothetical protein
MGHRVAGLQWPYGAPGPACLFGPGHAGGHIGRHAGLGDERVRSDL